MKVTFICLSLENTLLLSPKMLADPAIGLSHKHKIRCNFLRPFAVVTNTTGVAPVHPESRCPCSLCLPPVLSVVAFQGPEDSSWPSSSQMVSLLMDWGRWEQCIKCQSPFPRSVSCQAPWKDGSLTIKPVHGIADRDWMSLSKTLSSFLYKTITSFQARNSVTVSCISHFHTHIAPQAAADVTNALSKALPSLSQALERPGSAAEPLENNLMC